MNRLIQNFRYRPEIDGLRAIAVMAVVLFHAGLGVPGGYIGVDVFFVISGYLITSLIIKDLEAGTFSFWHFWERRIRRILPALTVMVLCVLALGWFLLLPDDYANLGKSAIWQSLFAANIYFWRNSGYFSPAAEEQPLLHTWSLAVEEQFYFFIPVGLFILFRFSFFRRQSVLLIILTLGVLLSLVLSIYGISSHRSATFYLLPTRAWELMLGSILAIFPVSLTPQSLWKRELMSNLGIIGILAPCFLYTSDTIFPGLTALPPCLGAFLYILSNQHREQIEPLTQIGKLLSTRGFVFIGLISYSLYLWHWPLFAFNAYWSYSPQKIPTSVVFALTSILLSIASWKFIEKPFRKKAFHQSRALIFLLGFFAILITITSGFTIHNNHGFTERISKHTDTILFAEKDYSPIPYIRSHDIENGNIPKLGKSKDNPSFLLWGDSHANSMLPAFEMLADKYRISGAAIIHPSSRPIMGKYETSNGVKNNTEWCNSTIQYIKNNSIKDTFLVAYWGGKVHNSINNHTYHADLRATVAAITEAGSRVWIIHQVPDHDFSPPDLLARQALRPTFQPPRRTISQHQSQKSRTLLTPLPPNCILLDPSSIFRSTESSSDFDFIKQDIILYRDKTHITISAAKQFVYPWLLAAISSHEFPYDNRKTSDQ